MQFITDNIRIDKKNNSLKFSSDNRFCCFWQTISKELYALSTHPLLVGTLKIMHTESHMSGNEISWLTKKHFQSECCKSNRRKREYIVKIKISLQIRECILDL